jgi:predicted DNA-binding transcriptional regulator YafY
MRASRLVSIVLLLQTRGRITADALAAQLRVSVRTIYRDIEALQASGVPLYGEAGHDGGYRLVGGYRTQLTGLTPDEAAALWLMALPGPAGELGMADAAATASVKVRAALREELRRGADTVSQRVHIDPAGWYQEPIDTPFLGVIADAVWRQQRVRVRYRRWKAPDEVERVLDPYGLVLKSGRWYVVAASGGDVRTYRISEVLEAAPLPEYFDRPTGFDLPGHWRGYLDDFAARRHRDVARVRLSEYGLERFTHLLEPAVVRAALTTVTPPDREGWVEASVPIESLRHAHEELLRLGAGVEVLAPHELRELFARTAAELADRYSIQPQLRSGRARTSNGSGGASGAAPKTT